LGHIDYGATALRRSALDAMPAGPSDLGALQAELAERGVLRAFEVAERFHEIGSPEGLAALETLLSG
jgi:NDP-sugar pyrophosphorylase family protein